MDQSNEMSEFSEEEKKGKDDDFVHEVLTPEEVMAKGTATTPAGWPGKVVEIATPS